MERELCSYGHRIRRRRSRPSSTAMARCLTATRAGFWLGVRMGRRDCGTYRSARRYPLRSAYWSFKSAAPQVFMGQLNSGCSALKSGWTQSGDWTLCVQSAGPRNKALRPTPECRNSLWLFGGSRPEPPSVGRPLAPRYIIDCQNVSGPLRDPTVARNTSRSDFRIGDLCEASQNDGLPRCWQLSFLAFYTLAVPASGFFHWARALPVSVHEWGKKIRGTWGKVSAVHSADTGTFPRSMASRLPHAL